MYTIAIMTPAKDGFKSEECVWIFLEPTKAARDRRVLLYIYIYIHIYIHIYIYIYTLIRIYMY